MFGQLRELDQLQELLERFPLPNLKTDRLATVETDKKSYPILGLTLGNPEPTTPTLFLVGGVHGLEKIGTQVLIAYFAVLFRQLTWDENLQELFKKVRLCAIPILNPGGMVRSRRSNPNGVDLMRNAPVESRSSNRPWLIGGHRISPRLPWYRGPEGAPLELEARTLIDFAKANCLTAKTCLALDFHSGFGMRDRLWYPYAKTREPFPKLKEAMALKTLLDLTYAHHVYKVESQSDSYTTHGDLWDYLFEIHESSPEYKDNLLLPWTLEMGSWTWLKKNPFQIFSPHGLFHPMKIHRYSRVMRRHILLIDFFLRAAANGDNWSAR